MNHLNKKKKKKKKNFFFFFFFGGGGGGLTGKSIYSKQFAHRHLIPLKCKTRKKNHSSLVLCLVSAALSFKLNIPIHVTKKR